VVTGAQAKRSLFSVGNELLGSEGQHSDPHGLVELTLCLALKYAVPEEFVYQLCSFSTHGCFPPQFFCCQQLKMLVEDTKIGKILACLLYIISKANLDCQ